MILTTNNQIFAYNEGKQNTEKTLNKMKKRVDIQNKTGYALVKQATQKQHRKRRKKLFLKKC